MHSLLHLTVSLFLPLTSALVLPQGPSPEPYAGLVPRLVPMPDGTTATVYTNPLLAFRTTADSPTLTKRLTYTTFAAPGPDATNDWCGEWNSPVTSPANGALKADCAAIAQAYTIPGDWPKAPNGYWNITAADWTSTVDGWITLAASGTCKFPIKLGSTPVQPGRFGANDIRFYMTSAVNLAPGNTVETLSWVSCGGLTAGASNAIIWKVAHV